MQVYLFICIVFFLKSVELPYLLECKTFKFGDKVCEVVLKSHMKCWTRRVQTRLLWTRPCQANKGLRPQIFMWRWKIGQSMTKIV